MKAMRGEYLGALDPYGYVRDPKDKHKLLVNEETAPIVKRIFEMCAGDLCGDVLCVHVVQDVLEGRDVHAARVIDGVNIVIHRNEAHALFGEVNLDRAATDLYTVSVGYTFLLFPKKEAFIL